ncbi:hypothetical protein HPP92_015523 [Vanilla planifolia]|uniref:Scarecrow-like protein 23 n=1 Tax=Vanilla planifolia TaxID=51239 RepID=A0A835UR64_VANPL|nr:hypothetical protein HPP92_015523 [Vanilla planifolia]
MQGEVGEDLLALRLSIGSIHPTKKRKRGDELNDKNLAALLHARDRMIRLGGSRQGSLGDEKGLHLVRLLLVCASAVDRSDRTFAAEAIRQLYRLVSISGDPMQRVAAHFADGLAARCVARGSPVFGLIMEDPSPAEEFAAFASLYAVSPYYQFAHFTANQSIIEVFEEEEHMNQGCLHVIDLDVSYGFQWPSLIQSLSDKATGSRPISLRITGFGRSSSELRDTEMRLSSFASGCRNLSFEFVGRLRGEKEPFALESKRNATIAVNLVFCLHTLKSASDISSFLTQIHAMNPSVVTVVQEEGSRAAPGGGFLPRFLESLHYFAAIFDSLDDCLPAESKDRLRIEKSLLGREIRKTVVEDYSEKVSTYERLEKWKAVMETNRFEGVRMSSRSVSQAKLLLKIKSHCSTMDERGTGNGFRISERDEGKAISLGWQDRHLITATAWRPAS